MEEKRKKELIWQLPFLALLVVGSILIIRQQRAMPYQQNQGFIFGTTYHITYQYDKDLQKSIEAELKKVDTSLSMFNPSSVISQINRNATTEADDRFAEVFNLARQISEDTDGAFDITVAPLVNFWGFGFKHITNPSAARLDSFRPFVGYEKVCLKGRNVVKADPRVTLDCSAIAKGYGVDVVSRFLRHRGVQNYMVEIGGEVITHGNSPRRLPWRIGVSKPVEDSVCTTQKNQTVLNVTDMAMATSGNYRNFYYKDGNKFAHTIDPKTGCPVQHSLLSATVLSKSCATADAYATAFMVMGMEKAKEVLERHPELMAYFIYSGRNGGLAEWYSPSMKGKVLE